MLAHSASAGSAVIGVWHPRQLSLALITFNSIACALLVLGDVSIWAGFLGCVYRFLHVLGHAPAPMHALFVCLLSALLQRITTQMSFT